MARDRELHHFGDRSDKILRRFHQGPLLVHTGVLTVPREFTDHPLSIGEL